MNFRPGAVLRDTHSRTLWCFAPLERDHYDCLARPSPEIRHVLFADCHWHPLFTVHVHQGRVRLHLQQNNTKSRPVVRYHKSARPI
jgi:hypothetical protein